LAWINTVSDESSPAQIPSCVAEIVSTTASPAFLQVSKVRTKLAAWTVMGEEWGQDPHLAPNCAVVMLDKGLKTDPLYSNFTGAPGKEARGASETSAILAKGSSATGGAAAGGGAGGSGGADNWVGTMGVEAKISSVDVSTGAGGVGSLENPISNKSISGAGGAATGIGGAATGTGGAAAAGGAGGGTLGGAGGRTNGVGAGAPGTMPPNRAAAIRSFSVNSLGFSGSGGGAA